MATSEDSAAIFSFVKSLRQPWLSVDRKHYPNLKIEKYIENLILCSKMDSQDITIWKQTFFRVWQGINVFKPINLVFFFRTLSASTNA